MSQILGWVESNPGKTAGIVVVGGLGLLLVLKRGGGGGNNTASTLIAANAQVATANAASQAQLETIRTQAQIANSKTAADLALGLFSTKAQADVATLQTTSQAQVANHAITADVMEKQTLIAAQESTAKYQTDAVGKVYQTQADIIKQGQANSKALSDAALGNVKNVHGSQNRVAIIATALGQSNVAVAAEQGQTASSQSSDSLWGSIISTIGKTVTGLFG